MAEPRSFTGLPTLDAVIADAYEADLRFRAPYGMWEPVAEDQMIRIVVSVLQQDPARQADALAEYTAAQAGAPE